MTVVSTERDEQRWKVKNEERIMVKIIVTLLFYF